jgi:hypothetical protein
MEGESGGRPWVRASGVKELDILAEMSQKGLTWAPKLIQTKHLSWMVMRNLTEWEAFRIARWESRLAKEGNRCYGTDRDL